MKTRFTAIPGESEGSITASVRAMSEDEAVKLAEQFFKLYFRVHNASGADEW